MCFFDLSKAFDTVWTRGLLHRIEQFAVGGCCLLWLKSYLTGRSQQVRVGCSLSGTRTVHSGVPQGSILGPLLFLLYVDELARLPGTSLYADDTAVHVTAPRLEQGCGVLQSLINDVINWMEKWKLRPNSSKTAILHIPPKSSSAVSALATRAFTFPNDPTPISIVAKHKHLGVVLDTNLNWGPHVEYIEQKLSKATGFIFSHTKYMRRECRLILYNTYIVPIIAYCCTVWCGLSKGLMDRLETTHRRGIRVIFNLPRDTPRATVYHAASARQIEALIRLHCCKLVHKIKLRTAPPHILSSLDWFSTSSQTRNSLRFPQARTTAMSLSPMFKAYQEWDSLPQELKSCTDFKRFASLLL